MAVGRTGKNAQTIAADDDAGIAYELMGSPRRANRLPYDAQIFYAQAIHMAAMFALKTGSNAVHGVPRSIVENVRAAALRAALAFVAPTDDANDDDAFVRTLLAGKASATLAHAMNSNVVTRGVGGVLPWPDGPKAGANHNSTEKDTTWRGGGFHGGFRAFFEPKKVYRVGGFLATSYKREKAQHFIGRVRLSFGSSDSMNCVA